MNNIIYLQCDMRYNPYMLHEIDGEVALQRTLDKVHELEPYNVVAGIYNCDENKDLIKLLEKNDVMVQLSNEENVTKRMVDTIRSVEADYLIRVSGDMCLLDVKTSKYIIKEMQCGDYDYFYYSGLNGCVPDIVRIRTLMEREEGVCRSVRYFDELEACADLVKYIPEIPLHSMCYPVKANSKGSILWLEHIIKNKLDIYELSNRIITGISAKDSELVKTGLLAEWGLPQDKKDFFVDENGEVNPWLAMSVIEMLKEKVTKEHRVFEWGAGNSTLFWSQKVKSVTSVELDEAWCDAVRERVGDNAVIKYINYNDNPLGFSKAILEEETLFDIILIDGLYDRDLCAEAAVERIKENGIIIVDNTDVEEYKGAVRFLEKQGFYHLKLTGLIYGWAGHNGTTSLFYKKENFMKI